MSNEYQISVESARIKIGPFTINLEQDKTVSVPPIRPPHRTSAVEQGPLEKQTSELLPGLDFLARSLQKAGFDIPVQRSTVVNLRCNQCHIAEVLPHVEAVREFMLLHAGHPIEMVP